MSTAVTAIETNDVAVRQLLQSLFHKHSVQVTQDTPAAEAAAAGPAAAAAAAESMSATTPLKLHPRVDAAHPMVRPSLAGSPGKFVLSQHVVAPAN